MLGRAADQGGAQSACSEGCDAESNTDTDPPHFHLAIWRIDAHARWCNDTNITPAEAGNDSTDEHVLVSILRN